jgi:hypothetical protein
MNIIIRLNNATNVRGLVFLKEQNYSFLAYVSKIKIGLSNHQSLCLCVCMYVCLCVPH